MTSLTLTSLLPAAEDRLRCAEHARSITVDPGGTAIRADRVIVVATPLPWPKPALAHPLLAELAAVLAEDAVPTRLLAAVPDGDDVPAEGTEGAADAVPIGSGIGAPGAGRSVAVTLYRRVDGGATEQRFLVADGADLAAWGRAVVSGDDEALCSWGDGPTGPEATPARPAVLLCVQGSHDVCCGAEGMRLAAALTERAASTDGGPTPVVHRVSHTGGHRFAPTAMTLPDGRMWADLDVDRVDRILSTGSADPDLVERCRGWWGAPTGAAQVAERAVFATVGWDLDALGPRRVEQIDVTGEAGADRTDHTDGVTVWSVGNPAASWTVTVRPGRVVPTIACRQPGGLPAKQAQEYEVLRVVAD